MFVWRLLDARARARLGVIVLASLVAAGFELVGVTSVMPFLALATQPQSLAHLPAGLSGRPALLLLGSLLLSAMGLVSLARLVALQSSWRFSNELQSQLCGRLYRGYLARPLLWHLAHPSEHLSAVLGAARTLSEGFFQPAARLLIHGLAALLILGLLAWVDLGVTMAVAGCLLVLSAVVYLRCQRELQAVGRQCIEMNRRLAVSLSGTLHNLPHIRLSHEQQRLEKAYDEQVNQLAQLQARRSRLQDLPHLGIHSASQAGIVLLVLYFEATLKDPGQMLPRLSLFAVATYRLVPSLQECVRAWLAVRLSWPSVTLVTSDLAQSAPPSSAPPAPRPFAFLRLRDVGFTYPGAERPALQNCSLEVQAGQWVGIVGRTGSGKSTLIHLLTGLLEPTVGSFEIPEDDRAGFQRNIGYVPQDLTLLNADLQSNIVFPAAEVDPVALDRATWLALIADTFFEYLPRGYQSPVGERGNWLSGGQRQRVGIARALYRNPQLLVLDEATSGLDADTERRLLARLRERDPAASLLMISHRLQTLRECDRIYVLDEGRIVASGTYEEVQAHPVFQALES